MKPLRKEILPLLVPIGLDTVEIFYAHLKTEFCRFMQFGYSTLAYVRKGLERTFHRTVLAGAIRIFLQMTGVNAIA